MTDNSNTIGKYREALIGASRQPITAYAEPHPFVEGKWSVTYTWPSGQKGMKGPFPSKASAQRWARGYLNDPTNR